MPFDLVQPSDGCLNVLCNYLANNMTLTKVTLVHRDFGTGEESSQSFAAFANKQIRS
jgi:hypothetical protein